MAPEVLRGEPADARGDVWALGVMLYELASGALPFQGTTGFEISSAILKEPAIPLPPRIPAGLRSIIQHCLAKDPPERYQRASELKAALEAIHTQPVIAPQEQRRRDFAALVMGVGRRDPSGAVACVRAACVAWVRSQPH